MPVGARVVRPCNEQRRPATHVLGTLISRYSEVAQAATRTPARRSNNKIPSRSTELGVLRSRFMDSRAWREGRRPEAAQGSSFGPPQ